MDQNVHNAQIRVRDSWLKAANPAIARVTATMLASKIAKGVFITAAGIFSYTGRKDAGMRSWSPVSQ